MGRGYGIYNSKEVKKEQREEAKADDETEEEPEVPLPRVTHVNNILRSIFSIVEVYTNNQQIYKSNGLYALTFYIPNIFKRAIFEYKGVLHCEEYNYEEFPDDIMEEPLSETFFTKE